ncbi:hypothetical protein FD755_012142 [Muntiacus reevesi]|uniref:Ribosomal protein L10e/L16 domain-containing protein n=1 Tax=Muntiacus reevesi TaxID=9886 RepID=A0A5N3XNV1_MUNRE|nr:hypothetical protein FD755_012142 [Muntiacus reevesi]
MMSPTDIRDDREIAKVKLLSCGEEGGLRNRKDFHPFVEMAPLKVVSFCRNLIIPRNKLQTGMCGAFGKPQGTVARVHTGQVIMSIRTKLQNKEHIHISKKWGFTKFNADEFENMVAEKRLIPDGCGVKYIPNRSPLDIWWALHS